MNPTETDSAEQALKAMLGGYADRASRAGVQGSEAGRVEAAAKEYEKNPDALHGDRPPAQNINQEKPEHVLMAYMQAQGKSSQEIADATGYAVASIRVIQRQPWFRKRFLSIIREAGDDQVKQFLVGQVMPSLETLVEIRDTEKAARPHVSAAAANSILDRALGKSVVHVETETHLTVNKAATAGVELEKQIDAVEQQLKARGIRTGDN